MRTLVRLHVSSAVSDPPQMTGRDHVHPGSFGETDPAKLFAFIEANSFGLLVSQMDGEPFASHLPFLIDRAAGPHGCLFSHLAAANPHGRQADGQNVLAIFSGLHAYISPTWYEAERVVPTWNYVAVHVYGILHVLADPEDVGNLLQQFVAHHEANLSPPWQFDRTSDFARKLMRQVTAFRIDIQRIEGKWKLNQNRPREQRERVVRVLSSFPDENSQAISKLMAEDLASKSET